MKRIDAYVIRWARRKFKQLRHQTSLGYSGICALSVHSVYRT